MDYSYEYSTNLSGADAAAVFAFTGIYMVFVFAIIIISLISMWKLFVKAGRPGWESIIPFYSTYILVTEVIKKPVYWFILILFVPFANVIFAFMALYELCKAYGKGAGFFVGMLFFPVIFLPILAFGKSQYQLAAVAPMPVPPSQPVQY